MLIKKKLYYFFYLELALKGIDDLRIYASENISHIPTKKLIEIFNINLKKDPHISKGYMLTKTSYKKHKKYITKMIGPINLDVFEYAMRYYVSDDPKDIRKKYKLSLME